VPDALRGLKLDLADGRRWTIRPVDEEAAAIVAELGSAMRLSPGEVGRELCVAVCGESDESDRSDSEVGGAVVCRLAAPADRETQVIQMERIASTIAREALVRGGLLLHGALADYQGSGFILAGPGTIGKSTASRRLPLPWRSLCDDTALVVRDGNGRFWAHPWPTWSLFHFGGPGGSWAVELAVPLRAIFFLGQSPSDQLEPVHTTQAIAMTIESVIDLVPETSRTNDLDSVRTLFEERVSAARALALAVPAFSLKLSLDGRFWEEIERVLPVGALPGAGEDSRDRAPVSVESLMPRDSLRVVCTGRSMNPTLQEPDLLEVKPYSTGRVRPGDVVCFRSRETGKTVVHRVVSVGGQGTGDGGPKDGIRTRGDNNPTGDPWVLQAGDIVGRVTAAQRGARRRVVHGGRRGPMVLRFVRLGRGIRRHAGPIPHALYNFVAGLGPFDRLLPVRLRPRLVRFDFRYRVFLKLLSGTQTVGQYDDRLQRWHIRRPFRLLVDEQALPNPKSRLPHPKSQ
jgi:signal peptidase I